MKNIFRYGYLKHKITLYFKGRFNKPSSKNKGPIGRLGISNFVDKSHPPNTIHRVLLLVRQADDFSAQVAIASIQSADFQHRPQSNFPQYCAPYDAQKRSPEYQQ